MRKTIPLLDYKWLHRATFPVIISPAILASMAMVVAAEVIALDQTTISNVAILGNALIMLWIAHQTRAVKKTGENTEKIAIATHTLSNSAMGAQLQTAVDDARALSVVFHSIARDKPGDAAALAAAQAADVKVEQRIRVLQDHLQKQSIVDIASANDLAAKG